MERISLLSFYNDNFELTINQNHSASSGRLDIDIKFLKLQLKRIFNFKIKITGPLQVDWTPILSFKMTIKRNFKLQNQITGMGTLSGTLET